MNALTVCDIQIRRDEEGRYCLNDLHKAAISTGSNKRTTEPHKFMFCESTTGLVHELEITQNQGSFPWKMEKGRNGGTYVCKELVYAYAMWISAKFHLQVIRAYDALVTQPSSPSFQVPKSLPEALRLAADLSEKNEQMAQQIEDDRPKKKFLSKRIDGVPSMAFLIPAEVSRDRCFVAI